MAKDRHNPLEEALAAKTEEIATLVCVIPSHAHIEKNTIVLTKEEACTFIASLAVQLSVL